MMKIIMFMFYLGRSKGDEKFQNYIRSDDPRGVRATRESEWNR